MVPEAEVCNRKEQLQSVSVRTPKALHCLQHSLRRELHWQRQVYAPSEAEAAPP